MLLEVNISVFSFSFSDVYGLFFTHSVSKTPKIETILEIEGQQCLRNFVIAKEFVDH